MLIESTARWFAPVEISFDQALIVAVLGLVVNGVSSAAASSLSGFQSR